VTGQISAFLVLGGGGPHGHAADWSRRIVAAAERNGFRVHIADVEENLVSVPRKPAVVGLHAVDMAKMERGAAVLVIGAGPVGIAVMLWAKFLGARHVIVSERAEVRRAMAARFGATDAVDPSQPLTPQVEKIAGRGPDIIFECVGAPGMIGATMMEAPRGARIVIAGVCQQPDTIMPLIGIMKEINLQFVLGYRPADFDYVIAMIASDRIDVASMITDIVDLDGLPPAFEALRKPAHQCKVMLEN